MSESSYCQSKLLKHVGPNQFQAGPMKAEKRAMWELLFSDFSQFQDFRSLKAGQEGNTADFRHIKTGEGLW